MAWWLETDSTGSTATVGQFATRAQALKDSVFQNGKGAKVYGPFKTQNAAWDYQPGKNPQPGTGSTSSGSGKVKLTKNSTFGQVKAWVDSKVPGDGQVWINWCEAEALKVKNWGPYPTTIDLNSSTFGPPNTGFPSNDNTAISWLATWLLLGKVGPGIAKALAIGITAGAKDTVTAATGAADSLNFHSGILGFLGSLSDPHTWLRVAEVTVGVVLLAVGINAFLKQTTGTSAVQAVGKVTNKLPKVVPI